MSIISLPQQAAQLLTVAAIDAGAKSDQEKLARALSAQSVASVFQAMGSGDVPGALANFQALIGSIKDPGLAQVVNNLFAVGSPFLQAEAQVIAATPLLGTSVAGWFAGTAVGMNTAAQAYISAYGKTA